jgi:hypothetical protein
MHPKQQPVRWCAVYTRKSSEEGLEQDFNSLDCLELVQRFRPLGRRKRLPT